MLELTLFIRKGCLLCEEAALQLEVLQSTFPFSIKEIDIGTDEQLIERYGLSIPVISYNGEVIQEGKIDNMKLILFLQNKLEKSGCNL